MTDFEKLGAFYLGREVEPESGATTAAPLLYDTKDLTTHAVCVGMTGSGKTGLGITLLEEAAIDGVPAIVIDPKGDMGNLLLGFPELRAQDFLPWIDASEAARAGHTPEVHAQQVAEGWRRGLRDWGQDGARIARLHAAVDLAIYTPGSTAGRQLSLLRSFDAPPPAVIEDREALGERIEAAAASLLALLGIDADPLQSREAILLANLLLHSWSAGEDLGLGELIAGIQRPPFDKLGVLDLESFFPASERTGLAVRLNGLLASPGFATWLEGEPLDVSRLLFTPEGKPRVSVLSIAHLSDAERMFFVTTVLNELVAWTRAQAGTSSLRALVYMDEIFGYFPPTANPPSKKPMLTLLKQARAYGLGVVLATQNPVDLDYKGLANTGTWFLGRLQTERDKARVLDGLEGAMSGHGKRFDRAALDAMLSGLGKRVFLMNNVHDEGPTLFQTRWALSYLRGPLTREDVTRLMATRAAAPATAGASAPAAPASTAQRKPQPSAEPAGKTEQPPTPAGVRVAYLGCARELEEGERLVYRPAVQCDARLHFVLARARVDIWKELSAFDLLAQDEPVLDWERAEVRSAEGAPALEKRPRPGASYSELPAAAGQAKRYARWQRQLEQHLYQSSEEQLFQSRAHKLTSEPGEARGDFRARVLHASHEARDAKLDKLRKRYAPKLQRAQDRILRAQEKVGVQEDQYEKSRSSSVISMGTSLLGALFSRKVASVGNVSRAGSAMKSVGRASKEKADIARAERELEQQRTKLTELEAEFEEALEDVRDSVDPTGIEVEEVTIRPRKADIVVEPATLVWAPYVVGRDGVLEPLFEGRDA